TLNHERYATFDLDGSDTEAERKQAVLAFAGDTYLGLDAGTLDAEDLAYAGEHLRILSGLYGVLRPTDAIQPHRLEMGTKLATDRGDRLYAFWGTKIADSLSADLGRDRVLLNLASVEYASSIDRTALDARVITPKFMEVRDGTPKVISFVAKKSRGARARWMRQERPTSGDDLPSFDVGGYAYDPALSAADEPVFTR
ncbi:MAG: peroxide stress protein YaaA, partial [Acidimicrobiia bacterium]|nr:peroxide stress protein YaaA [Acidimicrobiia bacterium]